MTEVLLSPNGTGREAVTLTVAGQWRSFTAFPSILAITVVKVAVPQRQDRDVMESISITSIFIAFAAQKVKGHWLFVNCAERSALEWS